MGYKWYKQQSWGNILIANIKYKLFKNQTKIYYGVLWNVYRKEILFRWVKFLSKEFAYNLCAEVGLNEEFASQISHSIREQIWKYRKVNLL